LLSWSPCHGSKDDLLVAVLADEIARVDLAIQGYDPALSLAAVIDQYVRTWIATYRGYSKTQVTFELRLLLSATENEDLRRQLSALLDTEIRQLAGLLENRIIDPARPSARATPGQAIAIATAMKAVLTGFGLREPFTAGVADLAELARQSCLALTGLSSGGWPGPRSGQTGGCR
jgi:AcrR family transcriptional regulator